MIRAPDHATATPDPERCRRLAAPASGASFECWSLASTWTVSRPATGQLLLAKQPQS